MSPWRTMRWIHRLITCGFGVSRQVDYHCKAFLCHRSLLPGPQPTHLMNLPDTDEPFLHHRPLFSHAWLTLGSGPSGCPRLCPCRTTSNLWEWPSLHSSSKALVLKVAPIAGDAGTASIHIPVGFALSGHMMTSLSTVSTAWHYTHISTMHVGLPPAFLRWFCRPQLSQMWIWFKIWHLE